jgi:hypothetical protein
MWHPLAASIAKEGFMQRRYYKTDEELREAVTRLNNLFSDFFPFREVEARKDHTDELDFAIGERELYYKREFGGGFGREMKLTRAVMEIVCAAILWENPIADQNLRVPELKCIGDYLPEIPRP